MSKKKSESDKSKVEQYTNLLYEPLEAFPDLEDTIRDELVVPLLVADLSAKKFRTRGRKLIIDWWEELCNKLTPLDEHDEGGVRYFVAWCDVCKYQTNPQDAAIEWEVDLKILTWMLEAHPAPKTVEERAKFKVYSQKLINLREPK